MVPRGSTGLIYRSRTVESKRDHNARSASILIGVGVGFLSGAFGKGGSATRDAAAAPHRRSRDHRDRVAAPRDDSVDVDREPRRTRVPATSIAASFALGLPIGIPATVVGALLTRWIPGGPLIIVDRRRDPRVRVAHPAARATSPPSYNERRERRPRRASSSSSASSGSSPDCSATAAASCSRRCS